MWVFHIKMREAIDVIESYLCCFVTIKYYCFTKLWTTKGQTVSALLNF